MRSARLRLRDLVRARGAQGSNSGPRGLRTTARHVYAAPHCEVRARRQTMWGRTKASWKRRPIRCTRLRCMTLATATVRQRWLIRFSEVLVTGAVE